MKYEQLIKEYYHTFDIMVEFMNLGYWKDVKIYKKKLTALDKALDKLDNGK